MKLLKTNTKNINSESLFKQINDFMMEVFATIDVSWSLKKHRERFVEMIDEWLEQVSLESGKFSQPDVMCDRRNNKNFNRKVKFTVRYKQKNCLNTSEIEYIFFI